MVSRMAAYSQAPARGKDWMLAMSSLGVLAALVRRSWEICFASFEG